MVRFAPKEVQDRAGRDVLARGCDLDANVAGQVQARQEAAALLRGEDDHRDVVRGEGRMTGVDVARRGDDHGRRLGREAKVAAPGLVVGGMRSIDPPRGPLVGGGVAHRPGPDDDGVGQRAEQAHHEPVGLEEAADLAAARGLTGLVEGDDSVEALHEVGDDRRAVGAEGDGEASAVPRGEGGRQIAAAGSGGAGRRRLGRLPQRLERETAASRAIGRGHGHRSPRRRPATS